MGHAIYLALEEGGNRPLAADDQVDLDAGAPFDSFQPVAQRAGQPLGIEHRRA